MCDCVLCFSSIEKQSDRNLVRGGGKFNVYEELFPYNLLCMTHRIIFVNSV